MSALTVCIIGRPTAKKNNRVARVRTTTDGRRMIYTAPNERYEAYHDAAVYQIRAAMRQQGIREALTGPLCLSLLLLVKGRHRIDTDNVVTSIQDILQDAGAIADDNDIVLTVSRKENDASDWTVFVSIENYAKTERAQDMVLRMSGLWGEAAPEPQEEERGRRMLKVPPRGRAK